ncbi:type VII secretion protein EccCa [Mycolicibacterium stellerae]|uniref:type VII secretion protein EccCa n=1 Tax=Mycolicibacterium stellerae TaxID=2358193 RepID=UPI000F0B6CBC|nr:type VII secretion protein EccCa [Mycolicibacterium stellerae]
MEFLIGPRLAAPPSAQREIVVQTPPEVPRDVPGNRLSRLLPAAMVIATVGMMVVYFTSGASAMRSPMFMFFPVMMLGSLLATMVSGTRGGGRIAEINQNRRDYLRYLASLDSTIANAADDQRLSLSWSNPDPGSLWAMIGRRRMWERRPDDVDFGRVRIGLSAQRLSTPLVMPDLGAVEELDPVTSTELRRLLRRRAMVPDLPVSIALKEIAAITVRGDSHATRSLIRAVLCQLAMAHSPQDLRIAAVIDPLTAGDWDWLKWLPHHLHPSATDGGGAARLTYNTLSSAESALATCGGCHAVLLIDGGLVAGTEALLASDGTAGVTVVDLGAACDGIASLRLVVAEDVLTVRGDVDEEVLVRPDTMTPGQALAFARRTSPYRPAATTTEGSVRSPSIGWPELMGIADVGALDPAVIWRSTRPPERMLRVPIGVSEHGQPIELDIKEAAANGMGPHGLCVGATGSGKSEFLRTLALGMIAAHPPDILNLVLVDFKGGASFLGFERAPHVAAVITNLAEEAHLVARMKDALAGEITRRQELLRAAGNFANIAEYDRARAGRARLAPLPALFIVVDEFSELLSHHPDFIDLFIAIGRLGRSLGMHLLLASQRMDEGRLRGLESHLSYRVCLKTFSAGESRSVLGVPDAYHLPNAPGSAYLKTGAGDPLRFQSAFVSGPYGGRERRFDSLAAAPMLFTAASMGRTRYGDEQQTQRLPASSRTVFDTVLDRVEGRGTPAHPVWLPPLAESPELDRLLERGGAAARLTVPIGLVDCPFEQRRDLLVAQLASAAGNVAVVGGPRSGKSTVLRTLILALARTHDPSDVQFYCLDFGGGALSSLSSLPHVGSVAGRRDVDLIRRTVIRMESLLRAREARRSSPESIAATDPYGDVFLVIDGWAAIRQEFDTIEPSINALAAQGLSYGIHVVISASRWAEMRPALKDQIGTRIELRLGDPAESEMDRKRARQLVQSPPGRGITPDGREFVIAVPRFDAANADGLRARFGGRVAPPIEVLPERVPYDALLARSSEPPCATRILVGIGEAELQPVALDFAAEAHLVILGQGECGKTATLRTLCRDIVGTNTAESAEVFIVDFRRGLLGVVESDHLAAYAPSAAALTPQLSALVQRLDERMPGADVNQQQLRTRSWWSGPEMYVVIDDYDLVAPPNGVNPLAPLLEYLPHAKDLGLHVVVARRSGGAARAMFDPLLGRLRDLGCMGLMMSATPDEGVLLGTVRPSQLPPGRGTLVTRAHQGQLVQIAWTEPA